MKLASIDYGRRRIGLAATDSDVTGIHPLTVIDRQKHPNAVTAVADALLHEHPERVVVGLPLGIDDRETDMSREVRQFAGELKKALGIDIVFADETSSSLRAQEILRNRPRKKRRDKSAVDRVAACWILQTYLEEGPVE